MIAARFLPKKHAPVRRPKWTVMLLSALLIWAAGCDKPAEKSGAPAPTEASAPRADATERPDEAPPKDGPAVPGLAEATDSQQMLLLEAKKAFLTEDITRAEALFLTLVKSKPVSGAQVSAVIALAQIYNETGRPNEAITLYDELSAEVSALPEIQLVIARAYTDLGAHERAIDAYQKLLAAQPDFVFAQLEIGQLYAQTGQNDAAAKAFYAYEQQIYKLSTQLESANATPEERLRVLSIFSLVSDERASAATIKALKAESAEVRTQAATVLGQMGAPEATAELERLSGHDPSPLVRMSAQQALKEIKALGLEPTDELPGPTVVDDKSQLPSD